MGLREGGWPGLTPGAGRVQVAQSGMLSHCYQSAVALLSMGASPGCKSDLNKAEDFSVRSGLAAGIHSGGSVMMSPVPGKGHMRTSASGC